VGSSLLALFGGGDKSGHHLREVCGKLQQKMQADGLSIPDDSALDSFTTDHEHGWRKVYRFLHKYPSETYNVFTGAAGGLIAWGAIDNKNEKFQSRVRDTLLGASTFTSGMTSAFVKEKPRDSNAPLPKDPAGKVWRWIQERPNRAAGIGYGISTVVHGIESTSNLLSAREQYGNSVVNAPGGSWANGIRKTTLAYWAYGMRFFFFLVNAAAEVLLAFSSKKHGGNAEGDKNANHTAYAIVADAIAHQPAEMHEQLIREYSRNFLAQPDIVGGKPEEIEATLRMRLQHLSGNPWAGNMSTPQPPVPPAENIPESKTNWQEKTALQPAPAFAQAM
jgi:hypothetical protein